MDKDNRKFLLKLLAALFLAQWLTVMGGILVCANPDLVGQDKYENINQRCPQIGSRVENLFMVSLATVLSLLGAGVNDR